MIAEAKPQWDEASKKHLAPRDYLRKWWPDIDHTNDKNLIHLLQVPPFTMRRAGGHLADITILTWATPWLRNLFNDTWQSTTPLFYYANGTRSDRMIRTTSGTPDWQRRLEIPIRGHHRMLNAWAETKGMHFTTLWNDQTIMEPQSVKTYDPAHQAAFKITFPFTPSGTMRCEIHFHQDYHKMYSALDEVTNEPLWTLAWRQSYEREASDSTALGENAKKVNEVGTFQLGRHWTAKFTQIEPNYFPLTPHSFHTPTMIR
jgi:hypothetical protein